ncbi:MAG: LysR family transcriptional regulator [Tetrasphaera sp.]|nr:LysR family transcriptional regulator [Tetrasphaera sp.]
MSLDAVGRLGSFSAAAEELGYTQSAVSQHIARLERIVGHPLVIRPGGPKRVSLTPAGEILLAHARAISDRIDSAYADLEALQRGAAGVLRVGCYQSVGARILRRGAPRVRRRRPRVRVELTEAEDDAVLLSEWSRGSSTHLRRLSDRGRAIPRRGNPRGPLRRRRGEHDPLASGTDDLPRRVGRATARDIRADAGGPLIENRLARPQLREQIVFRSNDNGMLLGLAAEGVGRR